MSSFRSLFSGFVLSAVVLTAINTSADAVATRADLSSNGTSVSIVPASLGPLQGGSMSTVGVSKNGLAGDSPRVRLYIEPVFTGQASPELDRIGNEINEFVSLHPDTFSGAYFSLDSSKVMVGVAEPSHEAAAVLEELANKLDPERGQVITTDAERSWSELDSVKDLLAEEYLREAKGGLDSVGLNPALDTVVVSVAIEPGDAPLTDNPTVIEIAERFGDRVMFSESSGPVKMNSAIDDVDPHFGGAGYEWYDAAGNNTGFGCSLAFPIKINNVTYGLTGGHCRPGSATNLVNAYSFSGVDSSRYFGSLHTTSWIGTEDLYGDFALLKNSTYVPYVYNSTPTSNSSLAVVAASFTFPMVGQYMCSSGVSTGQICRYKVLETNKCKSHEGQMVCEQIIMKSDQNLDGLYDCGGWTTGDSGGAVYNAVSGGVRAYGIVTASSEFCFVPREYHVTSLHGVQEWQPLASVVLAN